MVKKGYEFNKIFYGGIGSIHGSQFPKSYFGTQMLYDQEVGLTLRGYTMRGISLVSF